MKNTRTKRLLSVLSAGALIASMSAIPAFAATDHELDTTSNASATWQLNPETVVAKGGTVKLSAKTGDTSVLDHVASGVKFTATPTPGTAVDSTTSGDIEFANTSTFAEVASFTIPANTTLDSITWKVTSTVTGSDTLATFTQAAATQVPDQTFSHFTTGAETVNALDTKLKALTSSTWSFLGSGTPMSGATITYKNAKGETVATADPLVTGTYEATVTNATVAAGYALGLDGFKVTIEVTGQKTVNENASYTYYLASATDKVTAITAKLKAEAAKKYPGTWDVDPANLTVTKADGTTKVITSSDSAYDFVDGDKVSIKMNLTAGTGEVGTGSITYAVTVKGKEAITDFDVATLSINAAGQKLAVVQAAMAAVDIADIKLPRGLVLDGSQTTSSIVDATCKLYPTESDAEAGTNEITGQDAEGKDVNISAGTYYVKSKTVSSVLKMADGYSGSVPANIIIKLTVSNQTSNSGDDGDSGNTSDTAPDFKEEEMTTSKNSGTGTTFTHPEADVLQSKLNENKGAAIAIGSVTNSKDTIATFSITLPKGSKSVSENTVAQVLNVLNTINTRSASSAATNAVNDLLKKADSKNTQSMPISFSKSMSDFGMSVTVTVPVTSKFTNGGTGLYYYNSSTKALEPQKQTVAIRGGKASFDLTHASEYFLIEGIKELSAGEGVNDSEDTLSSSDTAVTTAASSEAPVVTAPEVTQAPEATTAPVVAANPGTGNAPIALAVIPVAVAAAAIIAKKAK